jgi:chemotaxis protein CheX
VEPIDQQFLVTAIKGATYEVFAVMLDLEITAGGAYSEPSSSAPTDGVVALVGLAGQWVGTGIIQCDAGLACDIYSALLGTQCHAAPEGVDGDVLDAVAELANMIVGNVKNIVEERLGPMGMSIPTVVFGRNFMTRGGGADPWTIVPFSCNGTSMLVKLCLTHSPSAAEQRHGTAVPRGFAV